MIVVFAECRNFQSKDPSGHQTLLLSAGNDRVVLFFVVVAGVPSKPTSAEGRGG